MALRIGDFVLRGELRNTRANSVFGWLEFAPDYGIHMELTGNLNGDLQFKHIRFATPLAQQPEDSSHWELPEELENLADRQIGVIGEAVLRHIRVPTVSLEEFAQLSGPEQLRCSVEKNCLYLEWYSQNGRMVAEIIDPEIEFIEDRDNLDQSLGDPNELSSGPSNAGAPSNLHSDIAETYLDLGSGSQDNDAFIDEDDLSSESTGDADDDPYGLFDPDLQRDVAQALRGLTPVDPPLDSSSVDEPESLTPDAPSQKRNWDEVIPGIDPETKAMYEQWDEIFEGEKDEPVGCLFETPLRLPHPDRVTSEEEAQSLVVSILAQLALLSVAVDVCEHFSPLQTYRLLMTEILPTAKVHPNLAASRMVQHYSTSDFCEECEAEFNLEYDDEDDGSDDDELLEEQD